LRDLVHEVVDVTDYSLGLIDSPKPDRYALQVGAALSRLREIGSPEAARDVNGHAGPK
jgi:hypothetical protein